MFFKSDAVHTRLMFLSNQLGSDPELSLMVGLIKRE